MREERLEVSVTFDERHGHIGSDCGRRWSRLSLGGLRRRIEALMVPDSVDVVLQHDGLAERERHRRRAQAQLSRIAQLDQRTALPDQCLHSAEADVRPPRRKSGFEPEPEMSTVRAAVFRRVHRERGRPSRDRFLLRFRCAGLLGRSGTLLIRVRSVREAPVKYPFLRWST